MKSKRILLVEDNAGDVELTREGLVTAGVDCRIEVVGDGEAAIDWLEKHPPYERAESPDVIILDLNLPRRSGMEVLDRIKHSAALRRIPVLVLTSSRSEDDVVGAYDRYANAYVTKPMDLAGYEQVADAIRQFWLGVAELPPAVK